MSTVGLQLVEKEVACTACKPLLEDLLRQGLSEAEVEALVQAAGLSRKTVENPRERISWERFCLLTKEVGRIWDQEDFIRHGLGYFRSPAIKAFNLVARQFYDPEDFYYFSAKRIARLNFTCVEATVRKTGPSQLRFTLSMEPGYPPSAEYFWITLGCLTAMPEVVGAAHAEVEMGEIDKVVHYDIRLPPGSAPLRRLRRFLTWPIHARGLAEELQEANELLHRRYSELEAEIRERRQVETERELLIRELEAKNEELEQFTYTVSHDLKSPLVTIQGTLGYLRQDLDRADPKRIEQDLLQMEQSAATLKTLLEDLLELSRVGRVTGTFGDVDVHRLAEEVVRLLAGRIQSTGVQVETAPDLPIVQGDRQRILQVLLNLVDNAVKFSGEKPGGRVEIGLRKDGEEDVFFVADNGPGLSKRNLETVFVLFRQLDKKKEGTGLGLALVRRIVEHHGGRIWAESEGIGRGACFCFTLPGVPALDEARQGGSSG